MTEEKIKKALALKNEITELKEILKASKNKECSLVVFTTIFGSNGKTVCNDKNIIEKVRELIILENELKLDRLETEFKNL
jgi:hypothetical protein